MFADIEKVRDVACCGVYTIILFIMCKYIILFNVFLLVAVVVAVAPMIS